VAVVALTVPFSGNPVNAGSRGAVAMARDLYRPWRNARQVNGASLQPSARSGALGVENTMAQQLGKAYGLRIVSAQDPGDSFAQATTVYAADQRGPGAV
jgi:hypothetical protein